MFVTLATVRGCANVKLTPGLRPCKRRKGMEKKSDGDGNEIADLPLFGTVDDPSTKSSIMDGTDFPPSKHGGAHYFVDVHTLHM